MQTLNSIAIVGGGAAGLFAAITAAKNGKDVTLFERGHMCGRKILITGKGRCNVTTTATRDEFFENIPRNDKFFYSAYSALDNFDTMDFFESLGVKLKVERGQRVFPESDSASEIRNALVGKAKALGVKIKYNSFVSDIILEGNIAVGVVVDGARLMFDSVILATGGISYPRTGSDGKGIEIARAHGHKIEKLTGALVPMICKEDFCSELQGLSLKNVELSVFDGDKRRYFERGEMMFTDVGVTGPMVLSASSYIEDGKEYKLVIDLKPALSEDKLDERLLRTFAEFSNLNFQNVARKLLPKSLIPVVANLAGISENTKTHSITKAQRLSLLKTLKGIELTCVGTSGAEEAIVTAGGVSTREINPKTMESKLISNLYFAGEMIDINALTGGFNLQIAFSTGYLAGMNA